MRNDLDIITIFGGTNDVVDDTNKGTMVSRDKTTFYGALHIAERCKREISWQENWCYFIPTQRRGIIYSL